QIVMGHRMQRIELLRPVEQKHSLFSILSLHDVAELEQGIRRKRITPDCPAIFLGRDLTHIVDMLRGNASCSPSIRQSFPGSCEMLIQGYGEAVGGLRILKTT